MMLYSYGVIQYRSLCPELYILPHPPVLKTLVDSQVPLRDLLLEHQTGGGLLCGIERLTRKMVGVSSTPHTAKMIRSRLVFGTGTFCRTHSTPPPSFLFDRLRHASVDFSDDGHLQVVSQGGKVLWSSSNDATR